MTQLARLNLLTALFFGLTFFGPTAFAFDSGDGSASGAVSVDSDESPPEKAQTTTQSAKRHDDDYNATSVDPPSPPTPDEGAPASAGGSPARPVNNAGDTGTL